MHICKIHGNWKVSTATKMSISNLRLSYKDKQSEGSKNKKSINSMNFYKTPTTLYMEKTVLG